jgi:hypothetical protein
MDPDPDADPDPAIFVIDLPKMPTKTNFLKSFLHYFLKVLVQCTSFSKIKSQKEVAKQYLEIKVFLTFFAL